MTQVSTGSYTPINPKLDLPQSHISNHKAKDFEAQDGGENEDDRDDDEWDLMRVLQQTAPAKSADDRFHPEGETVEFVEESMASYLNRKTSLLMLWFPLGASRVAVSCSLRSQYILLFSVSLIRIICKSTF